LDAEAPVAAAPLPAPPTVAEAATESAWERGLRHAKEVLTTSWKSTLLLGYRSMKSLIKI